MSKTAINLDSVYKKFNDNYVIEDLNFSFPNGETALLKGKNGIGKTTFFRLIAGIIKAQKGKIETMGGIPTQNKIRSLVNYMGPNDGFYEHLSAYENLTFFQKVFSSGKDFSRESILKNVDLWESRNIATKNYSTGMKKRFSLAISMIRNSDLYLFDEPFKGLDDVGKEILKGYLEKIKKEKKAIFMISNLFNDIEGFDSVYEMASSSVVKKIK